MKKSILIFCSALTILSLTACANISEKDLGSNQLKSTTNEVLVSYPKEIDKVEKKIFTDFIYDVGTRFSGIKKEKVDKATSIDAFFNEEELQKMVSITSVSVILIIDDKQSDIRETGYSKSLTKAQLKLLQTSNYATNFLIRAEYEQKNKETGELEKSYSTPHLTIVPEKQATYVNGKAALKAYLKDNSEAARVGVDADKLQAAKLFFTVTKNGTIENIRLDRPSGYPHLDKTMIELITKAPGVWKPAENTKGEKVDQELVISFGLMGC